MDNKARARLSELLRPEKSGEAYTESRENCAGEMLWVASFSVVYL